MLNSIYQAQLNPSSNAEADRLLQRTIRQAQSRVAAYLRRGFGESPVLAAVSEVVLRVESSIYNY